MRIKEEEKRLNLHEHDDDDDNDMEFAEKFCKTFYQQTFNTVRICSMKPMHAILLKSTGHFCIMKLLGIPE